MNVKEIRWIRRALLMAAAMIMLGATASAELVEPEGPDGHIAKNLVIDGVEVTVDADVYGSDVREVQAYKLTQRNFGRRPEEEIDLTAFLGDEEILERRTMWTAEDVCFETAGARLDVGPWSVLLRRNEAERYGNLHVAFMLSSIAENQTIRELPAFSLEEALEKLEPMLDQLGITAVKRPADGVSLTLDELRDAAQTRLDYGLLPNETVFTEYTKEDECYPLLLPYLYHGLMVMPTSEHLPYTNQYETPLTNVNALISRRGVEELSLDFIPGEEKPDGEPFEPIPVEAALETCEQLTRSYGWSSYGKNARIHEIRLGYVFLSRNLATTEVKARPVWFMYVFSDLIDGEEANEAVDEVEGRGIAIDAQTGEMLIVW